MRKEMLVWFINMVKDEQNTKMEATTRKRERWEIIIIPHAATGNRRHITNALGCVTSLQ